MVSNGLDLGIYLKFVHSNWCHNVHDFFAALAAVVLFKTRATSETQLP